MLLPLVSMLLTGTVQRRVARVQRNAIFIAIAALFLLSAYALAVVAAGIWLAGIYGAPGAALFLAAAALLLGLIVLTIMLIMNAQEARRARERRLAIESIAATGIGLFRAQPMLTAAIVVALLASNFIGSKKDAD
ncbi:hypothetical protein [Rhizobium sp. BK251]|uniref:hypothetical protein n=1 Tax=Rhizobium sp. BK251 TaxID=2512125 RepID=UPI001053D7E0|nr:hypothetical protein [Rhizobium sp. BK251]TCL74522.1 hypothetical protein EV286_10282 [Rhizobium sp. BK251]